jgi:xanthine/CO dehydrogenase XdhC/CoxF family maturation factor
MSGWREIVAAAGRALHGGRPAVLATVVRVRGSAYRRPGARMLIVADAEPLGMVSGGCLESDLAERAREVLASGRPAHVVYDMRSPDDVVWGLGLGCNGEVRVLLERLGPEQPPEWLGFLGRRAAARDATVVAMVFEGSGNLERAVGERLLFAADGTPGGRVADGPLREVLLREAREVLAARRSRTSEHELPSGRAAVFVEYLPPETALVVFGAGGDALPVVNLAAGLGWCVTVVDERPAFAEPRRFPLAAAVRCVPSDALPGAGLGIDDATAAVVMTHHFLRDVATVGFLLGTEAPYIGLLGPRQRAQNLRRELERRGGSPEPSRSARLYGPLGLDIGAETPEEIALATIAEIRAVLSRRSGGSLRARTGPLHEPPG